MQFERQIKNYIFFPKKKKRYVCLPYLKFSDLLPETDLFFHLALFEIPSTQLS